MGAALGGKSVVPLLRCRSSDIATATAATLTFINFAVYLTRYDPFIHSTPGPGRIERLAPLLIRIVIDEVGRSKDHLQPTCIFDTDNHFQATPIMFIELPTIVLVRLGKT